MNLHSANFLSWTCLENSENVMENIESLLLLYICCVSGLTQNNSN